MTDEIRGDLCVLEEAHQWLVSICQGPGKRDVVARFKDKAEAMEFASAEQLRRREFEELERKIRCPGQCPCYGVKRIEVK